MVVPKSKKLARNLLTDALLRKKKLLEQNESYRTNKWLLSGRQSKAGPLVQSIANKINGKSERTILNILKETQELSFTKNDLIMKGLWPKLYRKRTVEQILKDHVAASCSDAALVFASVCRAKKIPCRIIPAYTKKGLEKDLLYHKASHVFAEAFIEGKWIRTDPYYGILYNEKVNQANYYFSPVQGNVHEYADTKSNNINDAVRTIIKKRKRFLNKQEKLRKRQERNQKVL